MGAERLESTAPDRVCALTTPPYTHTPDQLCEFGQANQFLPASTEISAEESPSGDNSRHPGCGLEVEVGNVKENLGYFEHQDG